LVHGDECDPNTQDFDAEVIMRIGGGKKHGRFWLGDDVIDATSTPSLSQIQAQSMGVSIPIRPRADNAQHRIMALQVILVLFIVH
jgi:hypothetical protein